MGALLITAAVLFAGYLISLWLHPFTRCRTCRGTGRHRGSIYTYAYRMCRACGGNGRTVRVGVRVFRGGASGGGTGSRPAGRSRGR